MMNLSKMFEGKQVKEEKSFAQELNDLSQNYHTPEELAEQPFVKELMSKIGKWGIHFTEWNGDSKYYAIDKLIHAGGYQAREGDDRLSSYEFKFSTKDKEDKEIPGIILQYAKHTEYPDGSLWIKNRTGQLSAEKLAEDKNGLHFANETQEQSFDKIRKTITGFIENKS